MEPNAIMYDGIGSGKSNMTAAKTEKLKYFRFGGRYVGIPTSDLVVEHCIWFH
jgi:hypothetical protein